VKFQFAFIRFRHPNPGRWVTLLCFHNQAIAYQNTAAPSAPPCFDLVTQFLL